MKNDVKCTRRKENECVYGQVFFALKTSMSISSDSEKNIWYNLKNSWRKNRLLIPFFQRNRCLNGDFQFQCSNIALLFDQKYKWHTFAVFFFIFVASVDPLSKNKITDNHLKMLTFLQATNITWSDSTATSVFENFPVIHCVVCSAYYCAHHIMFNNLLCKANYCF
jgi:hypothetical protein